MSSRAYDRALRDAQREQRAKHFRALLEKSRATPTPRAPDPLEDVLYRWANPERLEAMAVPVTHYGEIWEWKRRACVLRAWCALRLSRLAETPTGRATWRRMARVELANAKEYARTARLAGGGR